MSRQAIQCGNRLLAVEVHESLLVAYQALHTRLASSTAKAGAEAKPKKVQKPDGWTSRVSPKTGRYATKLKEIDPDKFERMRILLGYYDLPENQHRRGSLPPIKSVTISNLQAIKFLDLPHEFKLALLSYRASIINEQIAKPLEKTKEFLKSQAVQGMEFVPSIPGVTAAPEEKS